MPGFPQPLVERGKPRIVRAGEVSSGLVFRHAHTLACLRQPGEKTRGARDPAKASPV
jgi:hypothetical protein